MATQAKPNTKRSTPVGIDREELARRLPGMTDEEKRDLILKLRPVTKRGTGKKNAVYVPQNDDELHEYIKRETGFDIPRVAVCDDHCAPFDFVADGFFERESALFLLGSREMGKTLSVAILHYINSECRPRCESITFGAIEQQAKRAYEHVKSFVYQETVDEDGNVKRETKPQIDGEPLRSETKWKTGSKVEIIVGTRSGVNSPHSQKVHADEVDLMEREVWNESRSQPLDTPIPTPAGWTTMGALSVGDEVFGLDGSPTEVIAVHEIGEDDVYRLDFVDGRSTRCGGDHLWLLGTKSGSTKTWNVVPTESLSDIRQEDPRGGYLYRYCLPENPVIEYPDQSAPLIHPYVLGVLLGDGCLRSRKVNFLVTDEPIVARVADCLPEGMSIRANRMGDTGYTTYHLTRGQAGKRGTRSGGNPNPFVKALEDMGLEGTTSHTKFIPRSYLMGSVEERLELLRGLMDTDGSFTNDAYFSTVSTRLASDFQELVISLGGRSLLRKQLKGQSSFAKGCGYIHVVSATLPDDMNPFFLPRKADKYEASPRHRRLHPSLRGITHLGRSDVRCITVLNDDGMYLTDRGFIPTHNSISSSKKLPDGRFIMAQDYATSTRKSTTGLVQEILDEVALSEKQGFEPPWKVYSSCFTPDTLVRARQGYVPISDIEIGDMVLSRGGVYRRVTNIFARHHSGSVIATRTSCGLMVRSTPDHRFSGVIDEFDDGVWATKASSRRRKHGYMEGWIRAENFDVGAHLRVEVPLEITSFDLEYVEPPAWSMGVSNPSGPKGFGYCQCGCGGEPKIASHTRGHEVRGMPRRYLPGHHIIRKAHAAYSLTDDFLWAVGLYCAEGSASQGRITYSLHEDETDYIQRIRDTFEPLDFKVSLRTKKTKAVQVDVMSTQLSEWWKEWLGAGCANKHIPSELMNLPLDKLRIVAQGVLDGDGCERFNVLGQTSSLLALQMAEIALRDGGRPTIAIPTCRRDRLQVYTLNNARAETRVSVGRVTTTLEREHKNHRGFWNIDGQQYAKVVEYEQEKYSGLVYDLTIEGDPSFVVANTLVHNCVFESAEEVPCCRKAPATEREKRLTALGRDPEERCSCDKVAKGEWSEGQPRTLDTVCRGKFFHSRGWMPHEDVRRKFRQNTQAVWEAQMECRRPMADGLYLEGWTRERFCVRNWQPKPELGQIWQGVDWGGGAESAILWFQGPLRVPVKIMGVNSQVLVPMGAFVYFDEYLMAGTGATKLADHVVAKEIAWRREIPGFRVSARFADMAGRQQRDDWREHDPPLRTVWYLSSRDFDPTVKALQGLVEDGKYWVDASRCSRHCDDIESWRQRGGREVHDNSSHTMAASRYGATNVITLEKRRIRQQQQAGVDPVVVQRSESIGPVAVGAGGLPTTERWRQDFDMPPGGLQWRQ